MDIQRLSLLLVISAVLFGCGNSNGNHTENIQDRLDSERSKWSLSGIETYQYTIEKLCECAPEAIVVQVSNGDIGNAFYSPSGLYLSATELQKQTTIDGLFDIIQSAIDENAYHLEVTYQLDVGYPERIFIHYDPDIADSQITYIITDLH